MPSATSGATSNCRIKDFRAIATRYDKLGGRRASLLLRDAGQEIDLARCNGALALMVIEETQPEGMPFLRKTTATLYWFDAGHMG